MYRRTGLILLIGGLAMAQDATPEVSDLFDQYLQERAALDPEWATGVGIHQFDDRLTRWDDASYQDRAKLVDRWIPKVPGDSLDAQLWRHDLVSQQFEYRRRDIRTVAPGLPFGIISTLHDMLVKDYAPKAARLANLNKRLAQIPAAIEELRPKLGHPPKVWTKMAIEDGEGSLDFLGSELGDADPSLVSAAKSAMEKHVKFLKEDLQPRSDGSFVLGEQAYEFHLKTDHFLTLSAAELERIGHSEFEKTRHLLEEISKDWPAVLEKMKHDHPAPAGLLAHYRREVARARRFILERGIVGIPEGEQLEVVETPAFEQSSIPYAAYSRPGPLDAGRTGHFYVTPVSKTAKPEEAEEQLAAHNVYDIPGTVWHEAYPGHHLQFVYAKNIRSKIRKLSESPLLSEGWGLYCEELAYESGYYTDSRERLMQLNWRLQRAARILLDVALHTGKMSYDEAVQFLIEKVKLNRPQAEGSVNGYTQSPTYFPTYLLGMLEIVRIREKFREKLGPRFSLKEFHERFLSFGNVPPPLIAAELDRVWK